MVGTYVIILPDTASLVSLRQVSFVADELEFYIACMLLSLEFLHNKSILHRDIKPENLVFDE